MKRELNRRERRRNDVQKTGLNAVEFQRFMTVEREKQAEVMQPSRLAQSVRFALRYPERKVQYVNKEPS